MSRNLRFGITTLNWGPWPTLTERWQQIEALGFDSVWVADHLAAPVPWFEGWTLLAALATQTSRIRIGTLVSSITLRHPALLARQALTLDHISNGRLELGLGAAGRPEDHAMLGGEVWKAPERRQRFRESVEIVDRMLRNQVTSYQGRYYNIHRAVMRPSPIQEPRPPLTLAAHDATTLKVVAEYADSWNSLGMITYADYLAGRVPSAEEALEATRKRNDLLDEYCAALGRDPHAVTRSFLVGYTGAPFASRDAFQQFIGGYREVGIDEFIFPWWLFPNRDVLERVASEWIPSVRSATRGNGQQSLDQTTETC